MDKGLQASAMGLLERHEGRRNVAYKDTKGIWTVGVGHNLLTPISEKAIDVILLDDLAVVEANLNNFLPWWTQHNNARQLAMIDLCFNLGVSRLLGFRKALNAWLNQDYEGAARELKDSAWFAQVGTRGPRIVEMVRTGLLPG